jgi:hypothetical protein
MVLLVDDILLAPLKAICQSVKEAAERELENEETETLAGLADLYQQLESGQIDQKQFDEREAALLDRLEQIRRILDPQPKPTGLERLREHFPEEFEPEPGVSG